MSLLKPASLLPLGAAMVASPQSIMIHICTRMLKQGLVVWVLLCI